MLTWNVYFAVTVIIITYGRGGLGGRTLASRAGDYVSNHIIINLNH